MPHPLPLTTVALLASAATAQQHAWVRSPVNGHEYPVTAPGTWQDAENAARAVGAHLATIRSAAEQQWIEQQFGTADNTWIGLNDVAVEGTFVWSSGESSSWRNWCPNEPNGRAGEHYVHLAAFAGQCFGPWNDAVGTRLYRGLIERDPVALDWQFDPPVTWAGSGVGLGAAYDPLRGVVVAASGLPPLAATWLFDGRAWRASPAAPPPAVSRAMAFDGARVISVGGPTTWGFDGVQWSVLSTVPGPALDGARFACDRARGRVVAFGGASLASLSDETWEWDGSAWTLRQPATVPPARFRQAMTFDAARGVVVMHGGSDGLLGAIHPRSDTWEWDGVDWVERHPTTVPPPRASHTLTWIDGTGLSVLFGGEVNGTAASDLWIWDGDDWNAAVGATGQPIARSNHAAAGFPGPDGQQVVVVGGTTLGVFRQDAQSIRSTRAFAAYRLRGAGCGGSTVPGLAFDGLPALGRAFTLRGAGLPVFQVAVLLFGFDETFGGAPLPIDLAFAGMPGCALWSSAAIALAGVTDGTGTAAWTWTVPHDAGLIGARFDNQVVARDPGANPAGLVVTRGGEGAFGR